MASTLKVSYRDIAKMFVKALPVEGREFGDKVEQYLDVIKGMPAVSKVALKSAYIFSRKVPREEREDLFQDIALAILEAKTKDERLAYAIARCDWQNWWGKYKIRQHQSLDSIIEDDEGNPVTLGELIVGEVEFERKVDGELDAQRIWDKLPEDIKPIVEKRLMGKPLSTVRNGRGRPSTDTALSNCERQRLSRWIKREGYQLLMA
jgi:hypothetical protein